MLEQLTEQRAAIAELCSRFAVRRLAVFGSVTAGGFDPGHSDIDFLVEFDPEGSVSRFDAFFGFKESLEELLGRSVDLITPTALENPYFAASVEQTREEFYSGSVEHTWGSIGVPRRTSP